jgi:hypothetical protein
MSMVGALGPVVHGAKRTRRRTIGAYGTGLVLGSLVLALVLGLAGQALRGAGLRPVAIVLVAAALTLSCLQLLGLRPLQSRWQVPERWRRQIDIEILGLLYGFLLGLGIFTAVVVSVFWVLVVLTLLVQPVVAVAGWLLYAFVRLAGFVVVAKLPEGTETLFSTGVRKRVLVVGAVLIGAIAAAPQLLSAGV